MSVILLADDSPHAQRMGDRILREEGYEVVCVADGETAALRLAEVDPDVVIADTRLPGLSGWELCRYVKSSGRHARVILTAGSLEELDEAAAISRGCDAFLRKPFEASVVMETVAPLARAARLARSAEPAAAARDRGEEVQAAVARAVEQELPRVVEEITRKVLLALSR
jgi:CheY-like chemotaxis protein